MHAAAHLTAEFLSGFIAGVAIAAVAGWFLRDKIRRWLPRKGATINGIPERYRFAVVCAFAAGLIAVAVFVVR